MHSEQKRRRRMHASYFTSLVPNRGTSLATTYFSKEVFLHIFTIKLLRLQVNGRLSLTHHSITKLGSVSINIKRSSYIKPKEKIQIQKIKGIFLIMYFFLLIFFLIMLQPRNDSPHVRVSLTNLKS